MKIYRCYDCSEESFITDNTKEALAHITDGYKVEVAEVEWKPAKVTIEAGSDDDWIAWAGVNEDGPKFLGYKTEVEVKFRNGRTVADFVEAFCWTHLEEDDDIVAYRLTE